jgi:glucan 1,3-beta-glucosidase
MLGGLRVKKAAVLCCALLAASLGSSALALDTQTPAVSVVTTAAPVASTTHAPAAAVAPKTEAAKGAEEDRKEETPAPKEESPAPTTKAPKPTTAAPTPAPTHDDKWYWENEQDPRFRAASGEFKDFKPDDDTQTCSHDTHSTPFNKQVRGANLGGWLVLEPWITPSLFYQFLSTQERFGDQAPEKTAMDMYTFCTALGDEEANRQLRIHWANWVTEDDIREMAEAGTNSLRVPVADWMFTPYEPFIGCTEGAVEELDRVADLALKYNIDLLIDIHGLIGSQNGFDNSGRSSSVKWTSIASTKPVGTTTFEHWPIRTAEWAGTFDPVNLNYSSINYANLNQSLTAVTEIITRYANHPAFLGLQPVNEPWELTPIPVLKEYYWKSYKRVKALAPHWKFVLHDSFRFGVEYWSTFMKGCPDIALDTHIYQAWMNPGTKEDFFSNACQQKYTITSMENALMPVIVGEWSLGTDNCAMWLNGFNDNLPGFPKVICKLESCPVNSTYLGDGFPGTPLDVTKPIQGPYGTGMSGPSFGKCPVTSDNAFEQEDDLDFTRNLNMKKLNAFALGHGWYFWNFKTEIGTRWSYLALIRQGAFPKNVSSYAAEDGVFEACEKEDKGDFVCAAKRGVKKYELENSKAYACNAPGMNCTGVEDRFATLEEQCDWIFDKYWHLNRESGATCDFGGAGHLLNVPVKHTHIVPGLHWHEHSGTSTGSHAGLPHSTFAIISMVVAGVVVVGIAGTAIYRWRQRASRRGEYSPITGRA